MLADAVMCCSYMRYIKHVGGYAEEEKKHRKRLL